MTELLWAVIALSLAGALMASAIGAVVMLAIMVRSAWRSMRATERLIAESDARMRKVHDGLESAHKTEHRFKP